MSFQFSSQIFTVKEIRTVSFQNWDSVIRLGKLISWNPADIRRSWIIEIATTDAFLQGRNR